MGLINIVMPNATILEVSGHCFHDSVELSDQGVAQERKRYRLGTWGGHQGSEIWILVPRSDNIFGIAGRAEDPSQPVLGISLRLDPPCTVTFTTRTRSDTNHYLDTISTGSVAGGGGCMRLDPPCAPSSQWYLHNLRPRSRSPGSNVVI